MKEDDCFVELILEYTNKKVERRVVTGRSCINNYVKEHLDPNKIYSYTELNDVYINSIFHGPGTSTDYVLKFIKGIIDYIKSDQETKLNKINREILILEKYIERCPKGRNVKKARERIESLRLFCPEPLYVKFTSIKVW